MVRWCALIAAVFLAILASLGTLSLLEAHRTGTAWYRPNPRMPATIRVTKAESPEEFDEAIRLQSFHIIAFGSVALVAFWFYRRLSE